MSALRRLGAHVRPLAMLFSLLLIWWGFNSVTQGAFFDARNLSNLFRQMAITGILASGMVLIIVMGQIDLSVGSMAALLGGVLAILDRLGWPPLLTFVSVIGLGLVVGGAQGSLVSYFRIPAFIVTLGGMMSFRGAAMWVTGNSTIPLTSESILVWGTGSLAPLLTKYLFIAGACLVVVYFAREWYRRRRLSLGDNYQVELGISLFVAAMILGLSGWVFLSYEGLPYPVLVMIVVGLLFQGLARRTVWGRHFFAIGGNKEAAYLSGVPVRARMVTVFILSGILSAIAGLVLTARVGSASPDAGQLLELDAIAACVIGGTSLMGGRGTIYGALLGALVIESLNNGMSLANMEPYWQYIIKGLVLVVAVGVDVASRPKRGLID